MTSEKGELLGLQAGRPRTMEMPEGVRVDFRDATWTSGIFKAAVIGAAQVTAAGMEGDGQADLENHGGPDNVILAYDTDHYPAWRERLEMPELEYGHFGENFSVRGFTDDMVCIGDIWEVGGGLRLQITQARQPCYKLARRLRQPHMVKMVRENSWGGWYLRVLRDGVAEKGMTIQLIARAHPEWTIARAVQVMYARKKEIVAAKALSELMELSTRWKRELLE